MAEAEFICPLCQQSNACGINADEPCWCVAKKIPNELINQVPAEQKNKSCICASCVDKFNKLAKAVS